MFVNSNKNLNIFKKIFSLHKYVNCLIINCYSYYNLTQEQYFDKIFIQHENVEYFIFFIPYEAYLFFNDEKKFNDLLVSKNKTIIYFFGGIFLKKQPLYSNLIFKYFDSFFVFNKIFNGNDNLENYILKMNKFVSLNVLKKGRNYRYYFHKKINEEIDLDKNKSIIFRLINKNKDEKLRITKNGDYYFYYNKDDLKNIIDNKFEQNKVDKNYMSGFFDIVCETYIDEYFFVTEKTIRPLYFKRPFIVLSCKNFHYLLNKKYKLQLYDEIIDYSFDSVDDEKTRIDMIINEIKRIDDTYTIEDIYNLTKEKVIYNYEVLVSTFDIYNNFFDEKKINIKIKYKKLMEEIIKKKDILY